MNNNPALMKFLATDRSLAVASTLEEDIRQGDVTAELIDRDKSYKAKVISREGAIFCGKAWVEETFKQLKEKGYGEVSIEWLVEDGKKIKASETLFSLSGNARTILTGERAALNFVQLLSATASATNHFVNKIAHTQTKILDTRKTIPGLRTAQKYAVSCGGGQNHRIGLYDAFLIKENHIAACGSITAAINKAKQIAPDRPVEIEVESLDEFTQALEASADIVMLDNFSLDHMQEAVNRNISYAKENNKTAAKLEASGNVNMETVTTIAETGVDYISIGGITKHIQAIDLSMRFV